MHWLRAVRFCWSWYPTRYIASSEWQRYQDEEFIRVKCMHYLHLVLPCNTKYIISRKIQNLDSLKTSLKFPVSFKVVNHLIFNWIPKHPLFYEGRESKAGQHRRAEAQTLWDPLVPTTGRNLRAAVLTPSQCCIQTSPREARSKRCSHLRKGGGWQRKPERKRFRCS